MKNDILENILFKDIIEESNDMVWILKMPETTIEYVNQTTCDQMGYTLEQMQELGMGKLRKSLPDKASFAERIEDLKKTNEGLTDYAILVTSDGSEFYIEVKARIIEIAASKYTLAIVRDISERVEMLQKIEDEAQKAKSYLDISKVIIMALDNDKNIIMINQAGCDLLGYTKEELTGKNFIQKCIPQNIQENITGVADDILNLHATHNGKINEVITKTGEIRLVSWKNSVIFDKNGDPSGILTSGEDITELIQTQKQLSSATKQAHMGEMLNMIAHQWRQPLSSISAQLMSLRIKEEFNGLDRDALFKHIDDMSSTVQHLSKTIDDFRNFSKVDKQKTPTTLDSLAKDALKLDEPLLKNANVLIEKDFKHSQEISLHTNEIIQAIMNILKNALDVFEERAIKKPTILLKTFLEDGNYCLSISDNGGGIESHVLPQIFDPYFTTKGSLNGTGIGMHMSKKIIEENNGGYLSVANTSNGAQFVLSFKV